MLGHLRSRSSDHKTGGSGHVEQICAVTAGPYQIHKVCAGHLHRGSQLAHHRRSTGDLIDGLALHTQGHQQTANLRIGGIAGHDLAHHRGHLLLGKVFGIDDSGQCLLDIHAYSPLAFRPSHPASRYLAAENSVAGHGRAR
jgi:hypothetical protein